jgi:hypothetical protein
MKRVTDTVVVLPSEKIMRPYLPASRLIFGINVDHSVADVARNPQ